MGGNFLVNLAISNSPNVSNNASRNVSSSGQSTAWGSNPFADDEDDEDEDFGKNPFFKASSHCSYPSFAFLSFSTSPLVVGSLSNIGNTSGGISLKIFGPPGSLSMFP